MRIPDEVRRGKNILERDSEAKKGRKSPIPHTKQLKLFHLTVSTYRLQQDGAAIKCYERQP